MHLKRQSLKSIVLFISSGSNSSSSSSSSSIFEGGGGGFYKDTLFPVGCRNKGVPRLVSHEVIFDQLG